jgi:hypothetical protein
LTPVVNFTSVAEYGATVYEMALLARAESGRVVGGASDKSSAQLSRTF